MYLLITIYWSHLVNLIYMKINFTSGNWKIDLFQNDIELRIECNSIYEDYRLHL